MKRKSYLHFAWSRIVAGLLAGAVIFALITVSLQETFSYAMDSGFEKRQEFYERIIKTYNEGKINDTFIDIFLNFYTADYYRIANVNEDGTFETIVETDYNVFPVQGHLDQWYYVTDDESLLQREKRTYKSPESGDEWSIEYKKCNEISSIDSFPDRNISNCWDMAESSDELFYSNVLFQVATHISGVKYYSEPWVKTFYVDGDTLHLGKVAEADLYEYKDKTFGKTWDFTDPAKADIYKQTEIIDGEEQEKNLMIKNRAKRPDAFLNDLGDIFLANSVEDIRNAYNAHLDTDEKFNKYDFYRYAGAEYENQFGYIINTQSKQPYTQGFIKVYEIDGKQYMVEYIITTAPFFEFYKPFLIGTAITLLIICLVISLIAACFPYLKYKKAYETNTFKNNLIDSLAHNMKTPLQILSGYAENLKDVKSDSDKDHYADQILAKTAEMNKDIEAILKTAERSDLKLKKTSVRSCIVEAAEKVGAKPIISGDREIKMDKDYFSQALYCLIDNAYRYKAEGATIDVKIDKNDIVITNKTNADKFTPGTGLALAGRILEQHKLVLDTKLTDGTFKARIGKKSKRS